MLQISKMETRFQEIVFLLTLAGSMSLLISGVFFLTISPEVASSLLGGLGYKIVSQLMSTFGYGYFLIPFLIIHIGDLILLRCLFLADFLRARKHILLTTSIDAVFLLILSSFLSVWQLYLGLPNTLAMPSGMGGLAGSLVGGNLFSLFGLLGALVSLMLSLFVLFITFGIMEVVSFFFLVKEFLMECAIRLTKSIKFIIQSTSMLIKEFVDGSVVSIDDLRPQAIPAASSSTESKVIQSKFKSKPAIITDHFHVYRSSVELNSSSLNESRELSLTDTQSEASQELSELVIAEPVVNSSEKSKKKLKSVSKKLDTKAVAKVNEDKKIKIEADEIKAIENAEAEEGGLPHIQISPYIKRYKKPDVELLDAPSKRSVPPKKEIDEKCKLIEERLQSFGIKGKVVAAHVGVTLTMFEFKPEAGVKLSKISSLADDLALLLGAPSIRLLTPIPGKVTVGIEVPNSTKSGLSFSEVMKASVNETKNMALPIPLGMDVYNEIHFADIAAMPHLLISGTTGSGKSVFMNNLISSLAFARSPKELRFLMIDPKMIELSPYNGIPHLLKPVVTDVVEAKNLLLWAEKEMDIRYKMFSDMQARNIDSFNKNLKKLSSKKALEAKLGKKIDWNFQEMPYIVIVIDELADLMLTQGREVEIPITRIAQKARAAGIHLIMATQRPSAEIVTGLIKTNFPTRISFKVSSAVDSRTILDTSGAEKLLGLGDMLFTSPGKPMDRLQGAYLSEDEVKRLVNYVTKNN